MNEDRVEEGALFQSSMIQYGEPYEGETVHRAIVLDPAIAEKTTRKSNPDFSAIAVVGISSRGRHFVYEAWGRQGASPREQIDKFFELRKRYQCERAGVEAISFQRALVHLMREEMFRRGEYFELETITHSSAKIERIKGVLQPRYSAGVVHHIRRFVELESQLLDFPNGHDDFPDAVAMAITLLDPYAAQAADPTKDLGADDYEPLDNVLELRDAC
jgi:predicted phage terminase large subunit-like protein